MTRLDDATRTVVWLAITAVMLGVAVAADLQGWFA